MAEKLTEDQGGAGMVLLEGVRSVPQVYILHENDEWVIPLRSAFEKLATPMTEWHLASGILDLQQAPPPGIFYNRMSASSHTRGHRFAPELTAAVLAWLTKHGRRIVNGERALQLELSKVAQYEALKAFNIPTPETLAIVGKENIAAAAERLGFPLILKHNRAGKGLGVQHLRSNCDLEAYLDDGEWEPSIDGITLVQRYVQAPEPYITRVEFIGGKLLYAVRVDTSEGFELCPADACQLDPLSVSRRGPGPDKFEIVKDFDHPLVPHWEAFLAANDVGMAGVEFIVDSEGRSFTYDVNTNTNYNPAAEAAAGISGMGAMATHLADLLAATYGATGRVSQAA
ncbi:MAG: ATP-grasp domain-containing protein [Hyphomicrobiaceae bacterium]